MTKNKENKQTLADPMQRPSLTKDQLADFQKKANAGKIPGQGSLFHIEDTKYLAEATRLTEREIWSLAVANMQQEVLCSEDREESALQIFQRHLFTLRISQGGDGREEQIIMHQLSKDEEKKIRSSLYG